MKSIGSLLLVGLPLGLYANGGGPLLLFISIPIFLFGQVWILLSETLIYIKLSKQSLADSLYQVFLVNLASTAIVGLGFPFLIAGITGIGMGLLPKSLGDYMSAIGTWVYDNPPHIEIIPFFLGFWLVITFALTIACEKYFLLRIWKKKAIQSPISINKLLIYSHLVSYSGLTLAIVYYFGEFFSI